jgi:hypothetical protein
MAADKPKTAELIPFPGPKAKQVPLRLANAPMPAPKPPR